MAELDWNIFESLSGAQTKNWELLCRELVRRNYARFGDFRSTAQQPGIEFHLNLTDDCSLGDSITHWGWQCRWYDLPAGRSIGKTRKNKIINALETTQKYIPELTDWVLWTRRSLTPKDQEWFYGISTKYKLHLWTETDVIGLLTGEAEVLKKTYFGNLVLMPENFKRMHEESMAPIKKRWEPQLHIEIEVERELKSALGTPGTWSIFREAADDLANRSETIKSETRDLRNSERDLVKQLTATLSDQSNHLLSLAEALDTASLDNVKHCLEGAINPSFRKYDIALLANRLRSINHPISISIAAATWEINNYFYLLKQFSDKLDQNFFAVIGDAGFGKTYLAAELTKTTMELPGGVFLQAKYLANNGTLDDLIRRVSFEGNSLEQLLEAIDAVGARIGRRIPILIDGLNESENPRNWKDLIQTLQVQLKRFTHCVIIVTLRSAVIEDSLPTDSGIEKLFLTGFEYNTEKATSTYFDYYKIDPTDALLPWDKFSSPLFLSLFCQATNPDREKTVGVESIPRSLTAVFEKYRDLVISRVVSKLRISKDDVKHALDRVGLALWNESARSFKFDRLRELVGDQPRDWDKSLARGLEEEGVLTREPASYSNRFNQNNYQDENQVSAILYDAFAGFIIADAIINNQGPMKFDTWLSSNWEKLDFSSNDYQPLAEDILNGFVGLSPRRFGGSFWKKIPSPLREVALLETAQLEPEKIDTETIKELAKLCTNSPKSGTRDLFYQLWSTRAALNHPLNSTFLNEVLTDMEVGKRDLVWTEWIRSNREEIHNDLEYWEREWSSTKDRNETDQLVALWISWVLTSSVRRLRDQATKTLYWYGLGSPQSFFEMVTRTLILNDPYLPERMIAAAYGVVMGSQKVIDEMKKPLSWFLKQLKEQLLGDNAIVPSNHWMIREYVQCIFNFAMNFATDSIPNDIPIHNRELVFGKASYVFANQVRNEFSGYLSRDFKNEKVGRLFSDRHKHDNCHAGFSDAMTEIKGRIFELGWRENKFKEIDANIPDRYTHRNEPGITDPYSFKYALIAVQETAGVLTDAGKLKKRSHLKHGIPMVDIDPSFPQIPPKLPVKISSWVEQSPKENRDWLSSGKVMIPDELLQSQVFDGKVGPWIAVNGFLQSTNKLLGRSTFGFIRGILIPKDKVKTVVSLLNTRDYLGNTYIPEEPHSSYTFAGEIPWSDEFAEDENYDEEFGPYKARIGDWQKGIISEVLSHQYTWESYHSDLNQAGYFSVPSKSFSHKFNLRSLTSSFDQFDPKGNLASITFSPPDHFDSEGNLLYLRKDLLLQYAKVKKQEFIWVVWGERTLTNLGYNHPDWCNQIYQNRGHLWRRIIALNDFPQR
jgi:hypothetical protein